MLNRTEKNFSTKLEKKAYKCVGYSFITFDTELAKYKCLATFNKPKILVFPFLLTCTDLLWMLRSKASKVQKNQICCKESRRTIQHHLGKL
jgi:hypothetical protein